MQHFFINILKKGLNQYLALDPESKNRLAKLQGKVVTIEFLGLNLSLQLIFLQNEIELKTRDFLPPNTHIQGTPLTLLRMTLTGGDRKHFFSDDVTITGDLDLGQQVIDLFDHLDIDIEEYASKWLGDVPAHQVGRIVKNVKKFHERVQEVLLQNVNEYVHEEANLFPTGEELQDFFADVDEIREDVDRMAARIDLLVIASRR